LGSVFHALGRTRMELGQLVSKLSGSVSGSAFHGLDPDLGRFNDKGKKKEECEHDSCEVQHKPARQPSKPD
jgi:hypothetical protein